MMEGLLARARALPQSVRFLFAGGFAAGVNWLVRFPLSLILPFEAAAKGRPASMAARAFRASSLKSRLRKPGPAMSTLAKIASARRRPAIFSAMARGLALAALAAASAPLH